MIHEGLFLRIGPSILACPAPIELQTANNLFVLQEASSYDTRLQTILFEQLFLLEQLGQLAYCVKSLCSEKLLFLNENFAQHLRLDFSLRVSPCQNDSVRSTFQNFLR